tara:strand:- start:20 stop:610 length:591 start_codon:yes stop_codon:yes gene_type:complete
MGKVRTVIVAMYRTGSTNLVRGLRDILRIRHLPEPWNFDLYSESKYTDVKNVIGHGLVKTLIWQLPPGESDMIRFYSDFVKHYDNVILLGRKNRKEIAESWHKASLTGNWYWSYYLEENHSLEIDTPQHYFYCDKLEELSEKLQIPITWYEDLYSGNLDLIQKCIDQWGLKITAEQLFKYVDPKFKYRLKEPKSLL